ncbi:MAG: bifunctional DNA primase/polymerase [Phycisphaerales bacterium]|nr:bifunctional DNA primase/polymerase [Phycisphaerales bacterium]
MDRRWLSLRNRRGRSHSEGGPPMSDRVAESPIVAAAIDYARRAWSVIPLKGKLPAMRTWKVCQSVPVTDQANLMRLFGAPGVSGVGVILGRVSGHLYVRDFDDADAYSGWAESHPKLARTLPTVRTVRGAHVYGRWKGVKPSTYADGELRAEGQYVVAPPSAHPSGAVYANLVPFPDCDVPEVDPADAGLMAQPVPELMKRAAESAERTESAERAECSEPVEESDHCIKVSDSQSSLSLCCAPDDLDGLIDAAIRATIPTQNGQRHRRLFLFARRLKGIPALTEQPAKALKPYVRRWFDAAVPYITTRDFDVTWGEFATAWQRVRWGIGDGPLMKAASQAAILGPPACASDYGPALARLAAILRELQRAAGESLIFLSGDKAGELVGVDRGTGTRYLQALVADGVLEVAQRPPRGARVAIRYWYRGDM